MSWILFSDPVPVVLCGALGPKKLNFLQSQWKRHGSFGVKFSEARQRHVCYLLFPFGSAFLTSPLLHYFYIFFVLCRSSFQVILHDFVQLLRDFKSYKSYFFSCFLDCRLLLILVRSRFSPSKMQLHLHLLFSGRFAPAPYYLFHNCFFHYQKSSKVQYCIAFFFKACTTMLIFFLDDFCVFGDSSYV